MRHLEAIVDTALRPIDGPLVAGVSGGADSVALLRALCALGRNVTVVTCDFHLRGDESTADRHFVADLCRRLGVECIEADMDVEGYISTNGGSVEMACRELRYDLFRRLKAERGAARIAVAHNADDNIETFFLNLMRGAGTEGLKGMVADTGEIIRPLLTATRTDIEAYLNELGQPFRTDSTNLTDSYRRNFIRHRVLPLLEERWPAARRSITTTQRNLRGEAEVVRRAVAGASPGILTWSEIERSGDSRTAIRRFTNQFSPSASQLDEMVRAAGRHTPGRQWRLRGMEIHSERDGLHLVSPEAKAIPQYHTLTLANTPEARAMMLANTDQHICWLPGDAGDMTMRHPHKGERIAPLGMKGARLISDVMKDERLTRAERRDAVVMADAAGHVVWIDGVKRSRLHLVTPAAATITVISCDRARLDAIADTLHPSF